MIRRNPFLSSNVVSNFLIWRTLSTDADADADADVELVALVAKERLYLASIMIV